MSSGLNNPVAIYTAATNVDAQLIASLLCEAGIEAFAIDDISPAGMYMLGTLAELHRPQVFVDGSQTEEAAAFLKAFEAHSSAPVTYDYCFYCGAAANPDQACCPECGGLLESSDESSDEGTAQTERKLAPGDDRGTSALGLFGKLQKPFAVVWLSGVAIGFGRGILKWIQVLLDWFVR